MKTTAVDIITPIHGTEYPAQNAADDKPTLREQWWRQS